MTQMTQDRHGDGPDDGRKPCRDCEPGLLDALKCRAKGLEARAKYNTEHLPALLTAREQYEGSRAAYGAARTAAGPLVRQARADLDKLLDRLQCLIDDAEVVERIDAAFERVQERIRRCGSKSGCYLDDDCDFDDVDDCKPYDVPSRMADIQLRTKAAEDCFADLITVPSQLPAHVTALQAEVAGIATRADGDPGLDALIHLYAEALVAQQHARDIWRGFDDVNEYVDCVCRALTCMLKGHTAIAVLVGRTAVAACRREEEAAACKRLRDKTADEVVATYLRRQRQRGGAGSASSADGDADADVSGGGAGRGDERAVGGGGDGGADRGGTRQESDRGDDREGMQKARDLEREYYRL